MEFDFGELIIENEFDFGEFELDALKVREPENLTTELTEQDSLIETQKTALQEISELLQGKISGGGSAIPIVVENTLIFSTGKVEGGVLNL